MIGSLWLDFKELFTLKIRKMSDINNANRYLFRGKRIDNGEWVEGDHVNGYILNYIDLATSWEPNTADHKLTIRAWAVDPSTVGQLVSADIGKIYEGDLVVAGDELVAIRYCSFQCKWKLRRYKKKEIPCEKIDFWNKKYKSGYSDFFRLITEFDVVGNIWDNIDYETGDFIET